MSGIGGHGGIVAFKTYFVGSGTGHGLVVMEAGRLAFMRSGPTERRLAFIRSGPTES